MKRSRSLVAAAAAITGIGALAALGILFLDTARAAVGPLPGEALLLPADAKFVGGIDVKRFTASPFYAKYASAAAKNRPETFRELEEKTGLNPERDLETVVFAGTPGRAGRETGIVVALGRFDRPKLARAIETDKPGVTAKTVAGVTLYLFREGSPKGSGALAFVDDRTLVLGSQAAVEGAIRSASEGGGSLKQNETIMGLLERVRPDATFWMVGDQSVLEQMPKNLPAGASGQQLALPGLRNLAVSGDMDPMIALEISGEATDEAAAKNLADVVRGLVALASLQASQRPELQELAAAVSVTTEANQVRVNARVPYELIDQLHAQGQAHRRAVEERAAKESAGQPKNE